MGWFPIRIRREIPGELRRSWRWPDSVEKVQSELRCSGANMAATRGDSVGWMGESRTATRRSELGSFDGWGKVKVMKRDGVKVSKVVGSSAMGVYFLKFTEGFFFLFYFERLLKDIDILALYTPYTSNFSFSF